MGVVLGAGLAGAYVPDPVVAWGLGLLCMAVRLVWGVYRPAELVAGVALGLLAVGSLERGPRLRGPVAVVGAVVGTPSTWSAHLRLDRSAAVGGVWRVAEGRVAVRLPRDGPRLRAGDAVVVFGEARPVEFHAPPGAPDPVRAAARGRIRTEVDARIVRILGTGAQVPATPAHPLLRALALGDRTGVHRATTEILRRSGTAHLLAISGFHVGLVAALAVVFGRAVLGLGAWMAPAGLPRGALVACAGGAALAFALSVGAPVSAQRAAAAVCLVAIGVALGRHVVPESLLGVVATGVIVYDPTAVGSPSFQLSFGAVLGLLTWGRAFDAWLPRAPRGLGWARAGAIATCAATIGTLPAAAWWFQAVAPWGPVANLLAVPAVGLVLVPCALLSAYAPAPVGAIAEQVGSVGADALVWALGWFATEPWHPAVGPVGALALCGVFGLARHPILAGAWVAAVLAWSAPAPSQPTVVFPDVGQGSAALVRWPDGRAWLVDAGGPWSRVGPWLRRIGVRHLDRLVVSHGDADHAGGVPEVLRSVSVGRVEVAGSDGLGEVLAVARDLAVPVVDTEEGRLHPPAGWSPASPERRFVGGGGPGRGRAPGDVGREVERSLAGRWPAAPVLALAHHGSRSSSDPVVLTEVAPTWGVAQVGVGNRHGHPHPDVVSRVAASGIELLRSDVHGTIEITVGERVEVRTHRYGRGWRSRVTPPAAVSPPDGATPAPR